MSAGATLTSLMLIGLPVALGAGIVRGFSGFGFSALTVAGVSLFMAPAPLIPAVLVLEIVASLVVWRSAVRDLNLAWLRTLIVGNAIFVPLGVLMLAQLPSVVLRLVVGLALLFTAAGLRLRSGQHIKPTKAVKMITGALSGFLNGLAASGGVAAALMMAAANVPAVALRGTIIIFLIFGSSYTLLWASIMSAGDGSSVNVFSFDTLRWIMVLAPGLFIGIWLGGRAFASSNPARFRQMMLDLLIVISGLGVLRALYDLA